MCSVCVCVKLLILLNARAAARRTHTPKSVGESRTSSSLSGGSYASKFLLIFRVRCVGNMDLLVNIVAGKSQRLRRTRARGLAVM